MDLSLQCRGQKENREGFLRSFHNYYVRSCPHPDTKPVKLRAAAFRIAHTRSPPLSICRLMVSPYRAASDSSSGSGKGSRLR